jgi:8-oxo-dGTP pyrophosphatase MutT (NUDIX family)
MNLDPEVVALGRHPKKLGAGLFFLSEGEVLLLTRNSSHNNATLSVPGGNVDLGEKKLLETAEREAVEELGSCPKYVYKGEITTW